MAMASTTTERLTAVVTEALRALLMDKAILHLQADFITKLIIWFISRAIRVIRHHARKREKIVNQES
jgi:hypothetical protein